MARLAYWSACGGERSAEQLPGVGARVRPISDERLSVDDRGLEARGLLHEPSRATGQVVLDGRHLGADRGGVEDVDVGSQPFAQEASIVKAPRGRRRERQHTYRFFDAE